MTKTLLVVGLLVALAAPAAAHGAPEPREIDVRLLTDSTSNGDYGACAGIGNGVPTQCPADDGAWDLQTLDVREAATANGEPALWFRLIVQSNQVDTARSITLHLTAGGKQVALTANMEGMAPGASDFEQFLGPEDVGDGFPKAYDAMVRLSTIGAKPGDTVTGIWVESHADSDDGDLLPGTWVTNGQEVPFVAEVHAGVPPEVHPEPPQPATHTLVGPAALVTMGALPSEVRVGDSIAVTLTSTLSNTSQLADVILGNGTPVQVKLDGGASRTINVTAETAGDLQLIVRSDLGAFASATILAVAPAAPTPTPVAPEPEEHDEEHEETKDSPAPAALTLLGVLLAIASRRKA